ncbi:MAG: aminopeptidase P family protein [Rhodobacteraceae bacterium]|nr:aminopeptidase P family protein [Paracoccaceae bacterium]
MFQTFTEHSSAEQSPVRLKALRAEIARLGLGGFLVPRADAYQGEYVAPCDARLQWLTGFSGSAGLCCVLAGAAGIFVDGRYGVQARAQVAAQFTVLDLPKTQPAPWICAHLPKGGSIGFDPWLHTKQQIETLRTGLAGGGIELSPCENVIDGIWRDRPPPPAAPVRAHPLALAGEAHQDKRKRLAQLLKKSGAQATILTLPDSIAWLLNIRGSDIVRNPIAQGFAILHADTRVDLFIHPARLTDIAQHLGSDITTHPPDDFLGYLATLAGPVQLDAGTAPLAIADRLHATGVEIRWQPDPCILPKACKNAAEIAGTTEAHLRDGAAMCEFLAWFEDHCQSGLSEIDVVQQLEQKRRATGALLDISFDTIAGSGPNGALPHYRVTQHSNRCLRNGDLLVLDSGGQYQDGTTDITRTLLVGCRTGQAQRRSFTRVLQGMIAVSQLRWPQGLCGRDLEAIGRRPLWQAGQDFDHGLGHGVGSYLCVHEGPQRLARSDATPLQAGMILSNEPGYYREGTFGVRIENLLVVEKAPPLPDADTHRPMLQFRTLTWVPIDTRLLDLPLLSRQEKDWLNAYHATCRKVIGPRLSGAAHPWLVRASAPI